MNLNVRAMRPDANPVAFTALVGGALAIALSGIFVRLSQTGPTATAFWRGAFAIPFLALWVIAESRNSRPSRKSPIFRLDKYTILAGLFFAGNLFFLHWSLLLTSLAASTLEANLAPVIVVLVAWLVYHHRPGPRIFAAICLALLGVFLMVVPKIGGGSGAFAGDLSGLAAACFYAGYLTTVAKVSAERSTSMVMFWTTLVFTLALLPLALTQQFLPNNLHGWMLLIGLSFICQCIGQGLIVYALGQLPASFGSVGLYIQPVAAGGFAWLFLDEHLQMIQIIGGAVLVLAVFIVRSANMAGMVRVDGAAFLTENASVPELDP